MVYFLIGAQLINKSEEKTWEQIKSQVITGTLGNHAQGKMIKCDKEKFRLGNLDQMMFINDQIIKQESQVESLLKKVERQYQDTDDSQEVHFKVNTKEGQLPLEKYLYDFNWDDHRFPRNQSLQQITKEIQNRVQNIDGDLRQKTSQVQETKSEFNSIAKKDGNLLVRDMVDVLKEPLAQKSDFVNSTYIQTFILVVQKSQIEKLKESYLYLHENVIQGTLHQFNYEDKDGYSLWSIKLLKIPLNQNDNINPIEQFIKNCKDILKVLVREFNFVQGESSKKDVQRVELETKHQSLMTTLRQTCEQSYSDLFISYVHLKYLRFLVESVMRFGTQEKYLVSIIQPFVGKEKKVQQSLLKIFNDSSQVGVYGTKEELEDAEDFFPFIYIPINIY